MCRPSHVRDTLNRRVFALSAYLCNPLFSFFPDTSRSSLTLVILSARLTVFPWLRPPTVGTVHIPATWNVLLTHSLLLLPAAMWMPNDVSAGAFPAAHLPYLRTSLEWPTCHCCAASRATRRSIRCSRAGRELCAISRHCWQVSILILAGGELSAALYVNNSDN